MLLTRSDDILIIIPSFNIVFNLFIISYIFFLLKLRVFLIETINFNLISLFLLLIRLSINLSVLPINKERCSFGFRLISGELSFLESLLDLIKGIVLRLFLHLSCFHVLYQAFDSSFFSSNY